MEAPRQSPPQAPPHPAPAPQAPPLQVPPLQVLGGRLALAIALLAGIAVVSQQGFNLWVDRRLHPAEVKTQEKWEIGRGAGVKVTGGGDPGPQVRPGIGRVIDGWNKKEMASLGEAVGIALFEPEENVPAWKAG